MPTDPVTPPTSPTDPPVTVVTELTVEEQKAELQKNMAECEAQYGGFTNIPVNHPYFDWRGQLKALG